MQVEETSGLPKERFNPLCLPHGGGKYEGSVREGGGVGGGTALGVMK